MKVTVIIVSRIKKMNKRIFKKEPEREVETNTQTTNHSVKWV